LGIGDAVAKPQNAKMAAANAGVNFIVAGGDGNEFSMLRGKRKKEV